mmetsp:Transcript_136443/g.435633  ORF Transcript_136443/g.435633 Transcript_136443/m.435633 type:complete len:350 (+) Transcript_136443:63-1112(+)
MQEFMHALCARYSAAALNSQRRSTADRRRLKHRQRTHLLDGSIPGLHSRVVPIQDLLEADAQLWVIPVLVAIHIHVGGAAEVIALRSLHRQHVLPSFFHLLRGDVLECPGRSTSGHLQPAFLHCRLRRRPAGSGGLRSGGPTSFATNRPPEEHSTMRGQRLGPPLRRGHLASSGQHQLVHGLHAFTPELPQHVLGHIVLDVGADCTSDMHLHTEEPSQSARNGSRRVRHLQTARATLPKHRDVHGHSGRHEDTAKTLRRRDELSAAQPLRQSQQFQPKTCWRQLQWPTHQRVGVPRQHRLPAAARGADLLGEQAAEGVPLPGGGPGPRGRGGPGLRNDDGADPAAQAAA